MAIKKIFLLANGNVVAFDKKDLQVPEEQGSAFIANLQDKLDRGVVNANTEVWMSGWTKCTVRWLIKSGRLQRKRKSK